MTQLLKDRLESGEAAIGAWLLTSSADVAEILSFGSLDFLIIDHEHGQGAIGDAIAQLRAIKGTDCTGIIRVPSNDHVYIKRALDAGATGILVPNVNSADEARRVVNACRYAPIGIRGVFSGMRAMKYGFDPGYHAHAADGLLVMVQVESVKAIDNIPEIAGVDGIDLVFIGPRDLSATLGRVNQFDDPVVRGQIDRAERAILESGKLLGSIATGGRDACGMISRGYNLVVCGSDVSLLGAGLRSMLQEVRGNAAVTPIANGRAGRRHSA